MCSALIFLYRKLNGFHPQNEAISSESCRALEEGPLEQCIVDMLIYKSHCSLMTELSPKASHP